MTAETIAKALAGARPAAAGPHDAQRMTTGLRAFR